MPFIWALFNNSKTSFGDLRFLLLEENWSVSGQNSPRQNSTKLQNIRRQNSPGQNSPKKTDKTVPDKIFRTKYVVKHMHIN